LLRFPAIESPASGLTVTLSLSNGQTCSYDAPQGFGRFALEVMNASIGKLAEEYKCEFEEILGTKLRVVYQHL
jgi:hypothetical protein